MWRAVLFILLLCCHLAPAHAASPSRVYKRTIQFDGLKRRYTVRIPESCVGRAAPLVVMLHGGLTNGWFVAYESKINQKAEKDGFIVAYPEGTSGLGRFFLTWNANGCCGPAQKRKINDVGFVGEVISRVRSEFPVDAKRIYVAGSSNGGMLAYRVGAQYSDVVAAVGSVNGCLIRNDLKPCSPLSVVAFNGTRDRVIRLSGGIGSMLGYKIKCRPARETMAELARSVGCDASPHTETLGAVIKEAYTGGPAGIEVCHYSLPMAHFWSGGRRPYPALRFHDELCVTDVMCDFFETHPKEVNETTAHNQSLSMSRR